MNIALVVTRGFGNGTVTGTVAKVVTRGYAIAAEATATPHTVTGEWQVPSRTGVWEVRAHTGTWEAPS